MISSKLIQSKVYVNFHVKNHAKNTGGISKSMIQNIPVSSIPLLLPFFLWLTLGTSVENPFLVKSQESKVLPLTHDKFPHLKILEKLVYNFPTDKDPSENSIQHRSSDSSLEPSNSTVEAKNSPVEIDTREFFTEKVKKFQPSAEFEE